MRQRDPRVSKYVVQNRSVVVSFSDYLAFCTRLDEPGDMNDCLSRRCYFCSSPVT